MIKFYLNHLYFATIRENNKERFPAFNFIALLMLEYIY